MLQQLRPVTYQFNPIYVKPYWALFDDEGNVKPGEYLFRSGRISGKTRTFGNLVIETVMRKKHSHAVVTRAEYNDIRSSVFRLLVTLITEYNLNSMFRISKSPFEIEFIPYGNIIVFQAIDGDVNRTKGLELPPGNIEIVVNEEVNELESEEFLEAAMATYTRYMSDSTVIIHAFNPPDDVTDWTYSYFDAKIRTDEVIEVYSTWKDIRHLLATRAINTILSLKRRDPELYEHVYEGKIINRTGLVFRGFNPLEHVIERKDLTPEFFKSIVRDIHKVIIAGDGANLNDSTVVGALGMLRSGRILLLHAYYYDPKVIRKQLDDMEAAREIGKWYKEFLETYENIEYKQHVVTFDNASWNLLQMVRRHEAFSHIPDNHFFPATDKKIIRDTKRLQTMFAEDMIYAVPIGGVPLIIKEIMGYKYDKKGKIDSKLPDDGIDMLKYGTYEYHNPQAFTTNL